MHPKVAGGTPLDLSRVDMAGWEPEQRGKRWIHFRFSHRELPENQQRVRPEPLRLTAYFPANILYSSLARARNASFAFGPPMFVTMTIAKSRLVSSQM